VNAPTSVTRGERELPEFLRAPKPRRPMIDLADEERRAKAERRADRALESAMLASREPSDLIRRPGTAKLALAIGLGVGAAMLGSSMATDYLVGRCLWPGMTACVAGESVFGGVE
jgi:hypothetical protein